MLMHCDACGAVVNAEQQGSYTRWTGRDSGGPVERYLFGRCPRCLAPFLARQERESDDAFDEDVVWTELRQLYPATEAISHAYPQGIRAAFGEALSCFRAKSYTATAIMCRKAMEGLAAAHGVTERNLAAALRELAAQNVIEGRLVDWADALRLSGNEAAHDVDVTVSAEDAKDILDFTKALLEYVYTFRLRFEEFIARRQKRSADSAQTGKSEPPHYTARTINAISIVNETP
jgi:hypothetical protein